MTQAELWEKAIRGKELMHKPTKDIYKLAPDGTIRLGGMYRTIQLYIRKNSDFKRTSKRGIGFIYI